MRAKPEIGRSYQSQTRVEEWMTAEKAGNKGVDVLSTPMLLQMVEDAAMQCIAPMLEPGEVKVIAFDGRRIEFAFSAFDEREKVAEGTHERYVVARADFLSRLEEKLAT